MDMNRIFHNGVARFVFVYIVLLSFSYISNLTLSLPTDIEFLADAYHGFVGSFPAKILALNTSLPVWVYGLAIGYYLIIPRITPPKRR